MEIAGQERVFSACRPALEDFQRLSPIVTSKKARIRGEVGQRLVLPIINYMSISKEKKIVLQQEVPFFDLESCMHDYIIHTSCTRESAWENTKPV